MQTRKHTQGKKGNKKFWNAEYDDTKHENLAISTNPSSDLITFLHWLDKQNTPLTLGRGSYVYDIGCGNGRNIIYLAKEMGMVGSGFDISQEAIASAQERSKGLNVTYVAKEMDGTIDLPDASVDLVLDMMASHFLDAEQRESLIREVVRILKPGGWFFYKTFLLDGDRNAKKLLREYPGDEEGSYIHPKMGVQEHVSTEREVRELLADDFIIHKLLKSHNHLKNGKPHKRRSMSVYIEKK
jgi:SAM-dependent methyltransferase